MRELDPSHDFYMIVGPEGWRDDTRYPAGPTSGYDDAIRQAEEYAMLNEGKTFYVVTSLVMAEATPRLTTLYL